MLGPVAEQVAQTQLFHGRGCSECNHTGFKGRLGLFEIFVITDEVRHLIYERVSAAQLRTRARELGMRTLREDGIRKVVAGLTTLEEIFRVTMGDVN